jgi:uncharacterized protein YigE (DUF2233 family)
VTGWIALVACGGTGVAERTVTHAGAAYDVVIVDLDKTDLAIVGGTGPITVADARKAAGDRFLMATNAGIFEPGAIPTGLFVRDGVEWHPIDQNHGEGNFWLEPNGVFWVDAAGAHVAPTGEFDVPTSGIRLATQSGPLLAAKGALHPKLLPDSTSLNVRSGVGVIDAHTVVFAISETPVRFYDFATLFTEDLKAPDALYLDGHISVLSSPKHPVTESQEFAGFLVVSRKP